MRRHKSSSVIPTFRTWKSFSTGFEPDVRAFVLAPSSDGVRADGRHLTENGLTDLASIAVVGHPAAGEIDFGSTVFNEHELSSTHIGDSPIVGIHTA
jgi:hypothetical protein